MGKKIPWAEIDDRNLVPPAIYECSIRGITDERTKGGGTLDAGCLMYGASYTIERSDPAGFEGRVLFDRFAVGTNDDPNADEPESWKKPGGPQRLKRMLTSSDVTLHDDMEDVKAEAVEKRLLLSVTIRTTERGTELNDVKEYYELGTRDVGTLGNGRGNGKTATKPKKATGGKKKTAAKKREQTVECPQCSESVPAAQFPVHMDEVHGDEDE